jgi:hypothetical protein
MIRGVVRNGMIQPLEPLPADWNEGRQVVVDDLSELVRDPVEADRWPSEMSELTASLNDAGEWQEIEAALVEADHEAKARVRREMGLP